MESKLNITEFRQNLRTVFDKFDTDKNGYLDHTEATNTLKELGHDTTEQSLKEFFAQVDSNHDGAITFEELFTWATSDGGKTLNPVKIQILRLAKKAGKQAKLLAKDLKDQKENINHHHIGTQAGSIDVAGSRVHASVYIGDESDSHFADVSKGLDLTASSSLILQFKLAPGGDADRAKTGLLEVFQGAKDFLAMSGMVPPDVNLDALNFVGAVDGDHVRIGATFEDPNVNAAIEQISLVAGMFLGGNITGSVSFDLSLKTSVGEIVDDFKNEKKKNLAEYVAEGISLSIDARIPDPLLEIVRGEISQSGLSNVKFDLRPFIPLLFLKTSKIQFDFNSQVRKAFPFANDEIKFEDILPQLKVLPIDQIGLMAPPLGQFLEIANEDLTSDLKIIVRGPRVLASVHLRTDGFGKLWDQLSA